jgi:hypothetical protein
MKNSIKLGNTVFNNFTVTNTGDNTIYAKELKEEFFGVFNINVLGESFLCNLESNSVAFGNVIIDNVLYENVEFKVIKSNKNCISINRNYLTVPKRSAEDVILESSDYDLDETPLEESESYTSLIFLIDKLKQDIAELRRSSESRPEAKVNYDLIHSFIKESIDSTADKNNEKYKETIISHFLELFQKQESTFKEKVFKVSESVSREIVKNVIDEYENDFREEINFITKENKDVIKKFVDNLYEKVLIEKNKTVEEIEASKNEAFNDLNNNASEVVIALSEAAKVEVLNILEESEKKANNILETLESQAKNNILNIEEKLIKVEDTAKNRIEEILAESTKKIDKIFDNINKAVTEKNTIIEEKLKKIEESNRQNKDITKQIIDQTKKYTDTKTQEAIRYARILLDYAGGGGTVAVQYANGGNIKGDLNIDGNVDVSGALSSDTLDVQVVALTSANISGDLSVTGNIYTYSSYLSGPNRHNLLDIFAGEGPGDTNSLDGGIF